MVRIDPISTTIDFFSEIGTSIANVVTQKLWIPASAGMTEGRGVIPAKVGMTEGRGFIPAEAWIQRSYAVQLSRGVALPPTSSRPTSHPYAGEVTVAGLAIALFAKNPWVRMLGLLTGTSTLTGCADTGSASASTTDYSSLLTEGETRQVNAALPAETINDHKLAFTNQGPVAAWAQYDQAFKGLALSTPDKTHHLYSSNQTLLSTSLETLPNGSLAIAFLASDNLNETHAKNVSVRVLSANAETGGLNQEDILAEADTVEAPVKSLQVRTAILNNEATDEQHLLVVAYLGGNLIKMGLYNEGLQLVQSGEFTLANGLSNVAISPLSEGQWLLTTAGANKVLSVYRMAGVSPETSDPILTGIESTGDYLNLATQSNTLDSFMVYGSAGFLSYRRFDYDGNASGNQPVSVFHPIYNVDAATSPNGDYSIVAVSNERGLQAVLYDNEGNEINTGDFFTNIPGNAGKYESVQVRIQSNGATDTIVFQYLDNSLETPKLMQKSYTLQRP
ncbi:MAG: hypothetical protein HYU97_12095 [Deltaproteobacteria bacterium]|nr:hypothetical protein [Deltaproteobacteria bacterium]